MKQINLRKEEIKKLIFIMILSICLGGVFSAGVSVFNYIKSGDIKSLQLEDPWIRTTNVKYQANEYIVDKKGGKITVEFPEDIYITRLQYRYYTGETQEKDCIIKVYARNVYNEITKEQMQDNYLYNSSRSVINIKKNVSKIIFEFPKLNAELKLFDFLIDNTFKWNPLIAIVFSALTFVFLFIVMFKKQNALHPEFATFVLILVLSTCMLILQPAYCSGWDEQIHFLRSYDIAVTFDEGKTPDVVNYLVNNADWLNHHHERSTEEYIDLVRIMNILGGISSGLDNVDYEFELSSIGYIFPAIAISIGKFLHLPFYFIWLMGKFANLLLYAVGMSMAIYIVPVGKRILMVFSLLPVLIFLCTTYSYDVPVIVFLTIGISIWIKEIVNREEIFPYRWRVVYVACMIIGCMPKAVYVPLLICVFFLPASKFYSKKDECIFKSIIVLLALLLMSTFVLPAFLNPVSQTDVRGGNTSVSEQMKYVLKMPFAYAIVLWNNVKNTFFNYTIGKMVMEFPYREEVRNSTIYSLLIFGTILTDTYEETKENSEKTFFIKDKIIALISVLGTIVLIWTALYLSFTEVGNVIIAGVQGRYYLPFLFLVYLCIRSKKIINKFKIENYQMVIMMISCASLVYYMSRAFLYPIC